MIGVERDNILSAYVNNQVRFLQIHHPHVSYEDLVKFVTDTTKSSIYRTKAKVIQHGEVGNSELKVVDLLSFIKQHKHRIITPSGTIYKSTDEQVAFDKKFIDMLRNKRDVAKQAMLVYAAEGRKQEETLEDFKQSLCKIRVNSIIGSNGNAQNAMYDLEAFNGVTSMARFGVKTAYTFVERFLTSSYYFPNMESVINYIVTTCKFCPPKDQMESLLDKYNLRYPLPCDLVEMFLNNLKLYSYHPAADAIKLNTFLEKIPFYQLAFVYYSRNLYNLFNMNTHFWKPWLYRFMTQDKFVTPEEIQNTDPTKLKTIDGDLKQVIATIYSYKLKDIQIKKCHEKNPELAKELACIGFRMQQMLLDIDDLIQLFLHNDTFIASIHQQPNIIRKCVGVSDTDSVIFTTKHLIEWFSDTNEITFRPEDYNINAIIVYLLTKSIGSIITHMSISRGATGDNVKMIEIKNEFLYPVFLKTNLGKHYAGNITIQEGNVLPKPKLDIKGVAFMSSNVPKVSHDFLQKFLKTLQEMYMTEHKIYLNELILMAYRYEQDIFTSLKAGEFTYFPNTGIRNKTEYKNPDASIYRNFECWETVFAPIYGTINLPSKVPLIPIVAKMVTSDWYIDRLSMYNPGISERFQNYLKHNPKPLTRIPISISLTEVPRELIPIIKTRDIIYKNIAPVHLALKSLGFDMGDSKRKPLISDYIDNSITQ